MQVRDELMDAARRRVEEEGEDAVNGISMGEALQEALDKREARAPTAAAESGRRERAQGAERGHRQQTQRGDAEGRRGWAQRVGAEGMLSGQRADRGRTQSGHM